jgi:hypothetical protein
MRDAAIHGQLPGIRQLDNPRFSPYKYGHALWAYLCGRYGDGILRRVLQAKGSAADRLERAAGLDLDALSRDWHASIGVPEPPASTRGEKTVLSGDGDGARLYLGPALSPDGARLMFVSERDRLSLDLFMADARTGVVLRRVLSTAADAHFDSLQYLRSAGAWAADGHRFALPAISNGAAVLIIVDPDAPARRQEIRIADLREIYSPSWSPDGTAIVFSALKNGLSDLFVYSLASRTIRQLTHDSFADLHPAWSPDGRRIAFATDRFTTRLTDLQFGQPRIAVLDLESGAIRELRHDDPAVKQINPQWRPDGDAIYMVRDPGGVSNVYAVDLGSGDLQQITDVATGVSGVTSTSPALAVAARAGSLALGVYRGGRYEIDTIERPVGMPPRAGADDRQRRVTDASHLSGPAESNPSGPRLDAVAAGSSSSGEPGVPGTPAPPTVAGILRDATSGLPASGDFTTAPYDDRLRLESIAPPYIGAGTGGTFGGVIRGGVGLTFGDVLKDRQLQMSVTAGTRLDDFAAQLTYMNLRRRWNWGIGAGFQPALFYGARASLTAADGVTTRETSSLRYVHEWGGLVGRYNIDRARRIELRAGLRRTGVSWETFTRVVDADGRLLASDRSAAPGGAPVVLAETQAAYVHDSSVSGPLGPVLGQRLRLEVEPAFGPLVFADVRADARRYFMPLRPFTFAVRLQHVGRYGPDAADPRLTPLVAGLQSLVRGYDLRTFAVDRCGRAARSCSIVDELTGGRLALLNLEVRAPFPGLFTGQLAYRGIVPIEAVAFVDAGYLWTRSAAGVDQDRFRSVGAGARANLGGIVFEVTAARPFDGVASGWRTSFLIRPGW